MKTICTERCRQTKIIAALAVFTATCLLAGNALALTAPGTGTFAYDLYDIGINQILKGPIGFVGGVACMVLAAVLAVRQMLLPAVCSVLGGAFLLKADSVVETIGALLC